MEAATRDEAIRELVDALPEYRLPAGVDRTKIAGLVLEREEEISTDLGNGIAIPHARCAGLTVPLVVFGRSADGVVFSTGSTAAVRLLFLLITPAERPEMQLALLSQVAKLARAESNREMLLHAATPADVLDVFHRIVPAGREAHG
jgi:mannitol/fructose-specific phosphotransferase system IIA component (Ntr-type)